MSKTILWMFHSIIQGVKFKGVDLKLNKCKCKVRCRFKLILLLYKCRSVNDFVNYLRDLRKTAMLKILPKVTKKQLKLRMIANLHVEAGPCCPMFML